MFTSPKPTQTRKDTSYGTMRSKVSKLTDFNHMVKFPETINEGYEVISVNAVCALIEYFGTKFAHMISYRVGVSGVVTCTIQDTLAFRKYSVTLLPDTEYPFGYFIEEKSI